MCSKCVEKWTNDRANKRAEKAKEKKNFTRRSLLKLRCVRCKRMAEEQRTTIATAMQFGERAHANTLTFPYWATRVLRTFLTLLLHVCIHLMQILSFSIYLTTLSTVAVAEHVLNGKCLACMCTNPHTIEQRTLFTVHVLIALLCIRVLCQKFCFIHIYYIRLCV